jgi:hypothetical protein
MGCLLAITAGAFPRLAVLLLWLARPGQWDAAFGGGPIVPLLGIIFLPFTTLMYVILYSPTTGLTGWDFVFLLIAVAIDVFGAGASAYSNKNQIGWRESGS